MFASFPLKSVFILFVFIAHYHVKR